MFGESHTSQFQCTLEILQNIKSLKTFFHKKPCPGENFRLRETRKVYSDKQLLK